MSSHLSSSNSNIKLSGGETPNFCGENIKLWIRIVKLWSQTPKLWSQTPKLLQTIWHNNCQTFLSNFSYSCRFHTANIWDPEKFGVEIKVWEESLTIVSKSLGAWDQSLGAWDQSLGSLTQSLTILIQSLMFSPQKFGVSPPESLMLSLNLKDDCSFYFGSTLPF